MRSKLLPVAALFFAASAWGATFVLVKETVSRIEPELFIFVRFLLGGSILLLIALRSRELSRGVWRDGALLGLALGLGFWLQTRGLMTIAPARSAFLTGLAVVIAPTLDHLAFKKSISRRAVAGVVLAFSGTVILTGGWRGALSPGDVLSVGCAILFGIHLVLTSRFAARRPPVGLASTQVLMVALLAAPFAATQSTRPLHEPFVIASIVVSAVLTTAVAMLLLVWAQARVSATEAAIVLSFEPVAAAITSIAFEGEAVQWTLLAGGGLILAAMLLAQTGTLPANVPTAHSGHQR